MAEKMHRIVLARRPEGHPAPEDFRLEEAPMPEPGCPRSRRSTQRWRRG